MKKKRFTAVLNLDFLLWHSLCKTLNGVSARNAGNVDPFCTFMVQCFYMSSGLDFKHSVLIVTEKDNLRRVL